MTEEKRNDKRVNQKCMLSYKLRGADKYEMSQVENFSKGGVAFLSDLEFDLGDVLEFSVRFPFFFKRIVVDANVVNIRPEGNQFHVGVSFINLPGDVSAMLDDYLSAMGI